MLKWILAIYWMSSFKFQNLHSATVADFGCRLAVKSRGWVWELISVCYRDIWGKPYGVPNMLVFFVDIFSLLPYPMSWTWGFSVDWGFRQHWASGSCGFGCPRTVTQGYFVLNRGCYGRLKLVGLLLPKGIAGERELLR